MAWIEYGNVEGNYRTDLKTPSGMGVNGMRVLTTGLEDSVRLLTRSSLVSFGCLFGRTIGMNTLSI